MIKLPSFNDVHRNRRSIHAETLKKYLTVFHIKLKKRYSCQPAIRMKMQNLPFVENLYGSEPTFELIIT
jgi:hypothetical protein